MSQPTATCPYCDEVVPLIFIANREIRVADHLDIYPTRVCEGSGLLAEISNGRVYITKRASEAERPLPRTEA